MLLSHNLFQWQDTRRELLPPVAERRPEGDEEAAVVEEVFMDVAIIHLHHLGSILSGMKPVRDNTEHQRTSCAACIER